MGSHTSRLRALQREAEESSGGRCGRNQPGLQSALRHAFSAEDLGKPSGLASFLFVVVGLVLFWVFGTSD